MYFSWSASTPVRISELVRLEAGVRSPGYTWNIILHELEPLAEEEPKDGIYVDINTQEMFPQQLLCLEILP